MSRSVSPASVTRRRALGAAAVGLAGGYARGRGGDLGDFGKTALVNEDGAERITDARFRNG